MNVRTLVLSLLLSGSLFGCATATKDIRVETESAPGVNLSGYTTYAWAGSAEVVNDPHGNWEPPGFDADAELRFLINRELRGKGMQEVTTRPDLFVAFAAGINMEVFEINTQSESEMYTLTNAPKGALVVVMIDPTTRNAVWASSAVGDVKAGRSSEEIGKRLAYAVKTMFGKFRQ
jgi:hypothetical protein